MMMQKKIKYRLIRKYAKKVRNFYPKNLQNYCYSVVVAREIFNSAGSDSVQVLLVERSWAPAEEVIWLEVPAMVMVVAGAT